MQDPLDIMMLVFFILIFAGIVVGTFIWIAQKLRQKKLEDESALKAFEDEIKKDFAPDHFMERDREGFTVAPLPPSVAPAAPAPQIQTGARTTSAPPDSPAAALIARLRAVNLLQSEEGPYLLLDPSGSCIMVRLKKDKTALIVPRFESEHFINMALQRVDYVFMIMTGGRIIVLNKVEDYLAAQWDIK